MNGVDVERIGWQCKHVIFANQHSSSNEMRRLRDYANTNVGIWKEACFVETAV